MFSSKTTASYYLVYDSSQGSNWFALGTGTSGHAGGHIYKRASYRHLEPGSRWTAVVDIRGGLKGGSVHIKAAGSIPTGLTSVPLWGEEEGMTGNGKILNDERVYDLSGRKLRASFPPRFPLKQGLYLMEGKKIMFP